MADEMIRFCEAPFLLDYEAAPTVGRRQRCERTSRSSILWNWRHEIDWNQQKVRRNVKLRPHCGYGHEISRVHHSSSPFFGPTRTFVLIQTTLSQDATVWFICFQNFPVGLDQQNSPCRPKPALVLAILHHPDGNESSSVLRSRNLNKYPEIIGMHYKRHVLSTKRSGRTGAVCKPHRGTKSIRIADALHGQLGHLAQPTHSHV